MAFTRSNIVAGFESTGLFTWNPLVIPTKLFAPSEPFDAQKSSPDDGHPLDWVLKKNKPTLTHPNPQSTESTSTSSNNFEPQNGMVTHLMNQYLQPVHKLNLYPVLLVTCP